MFWMEYMKQVNKLNSIHWCWRQVSVTVTKGWPYTFQGNCDNWGAWADAAAQRVDENNKQVTLKNCAELTNCISQIIPK